MSLTGSTTAEKIWNYLYAKIGNAYGVAGLMGNLYAESGLKSTNLQNSYESKLGYTDTTYTNAVDDGTYTKFASDSAGYGLAQWTYSTRKKNMLAFHQKKGKSIGDLETQLAFLIQELSGSYTSVYKVLKSATTVKEASDKVLTGYEKPADQSSSVKTKRASYGQKYYDSYAGSSTTTTATTSSSSSSSSSNTTKKTATDKAQSFSKSLAGTYTVTASDGLNVRNGAGTAKSVMVAIPKGTSVKNYGYYTTSGGVKWLYIQFTYKSVTYTGFASSKYLKKS